MIEKHAQRCEEHPVECQNKCATKNLRRKDLEQHTKECPLERLDCPYKEVGCSSPILREKIVSHMQSFTQKHLNLVTSAYDTLKLSEQTYREITQHAAPQLEAIQELEQDSMLKKSLKQNLISKVIKDGYKLENTAERIREGSEQEERDQEERNQLTFHIPSNDWNWIGPTFKTNLLEMCLTVNPPNEASSEHSGTLSLVLLSGEIDGQSVITIQPKCDQVQKSQSRSYRLPKPLDNNINAANVAPTDKNLDKYAYLGKLERLDV